MYRQLKKLLYEEEFADEDYTPHEWFKGGRHRTAGRPMHQPYPGSNIVNEYGDTGYDQYLEAMKRESIRVGNAMRDGKLSLQQARDDYDAAHMRNEDTYLSPNYQFYDEGPERNPDTGEYFTIWNPATQQWEDE